MVQSGFVFEIRFIDRLMRSPHAEIKVAGIAACISVANTLALSGVGYRFNFSQLFHVIGSRFFVGSLFFATLFAFGGWWTAHTWRQLWRQGRGAWERLVYNYGVRGFGGMTAAWLFGIVTWLGWKADSDTIMGPMTIAGAMAGLFFGLPVSLHLGHQWGRMFAALVGVQRDPSVEVGEPPRL